MLRPLWNVNLQQTNDMLRHNSRSENYPCVFLVCATLQEAEPLFKAFGGHDKCWNDFNEGYYCSWHLNDWSILLNVCGIGAVNTALHLGRQIADTRLVEEPMIQFGIAGAYDLDLPLAQDVYEVVEDAYADLGAHTPDGFRDLEQMGFSNFEYRGYDFRQDEYVSKRYGNRLVNPRPSPLDIPKVKALTVQAVSGDEASIRRVRQYAPDATLESMEGAAFFQTGLCFSGKRFYQFRAVSNYVEPRDPSRWKIKPAIERVGEFIVELIRQQPNWLNHNSEGYWDN